MKDLRILVLSFTLAVVMTACSDAGGEFPGSEYMPDMAHSLAVEANTYNYYYYNTWDDRSTIELAKLVGPRLTVDGTVPRGYAGAFTDGSQAPASLEAIEAMKGSLVGADSPNEISVPTSGHVPYYYEDSPEGRLAAMAEITGNPFPITADGLARGNKLYGIFCGICHGTAGNGLGYIYDTDTNPNAKYPLAPANLISADFKAASNGRMYHAIMYGYNVMGAYKDKLSYEERWQVIHYIRALQAADSKLEYSEVANDYNPALGTPGNKFAAAGQQVTDGEQMGAAGQLTQESSPAANQQLRK